MLGGFSAVTEREAGFPTSHGPVLTEGGNIIPLTCPESSAAPEILHPGPDETVVNVDSPPVELRLPTNRPWASPDEWSDVLEDPDR